jgi:hypothetical protein
MECPHDLFILSQRLLTRWQPGDQRPVILLVVRPSEKSNLEICSGWEDLKIEICPFALKQYRTLKLDPLNCIMDGVKTIAEKSGYGSIVIKPRHKAKPKGGVMLFEIACTTTFHIGVELKSV